MSDTIYNAMLIYITGLVLATILFYEGGRRGKAKNPEVWGTIFGLLWPITVPILLFMLISSYWKDHNS